MSKQKSMGEFAAIRFWELVNKDGHGSCNMNTLSKEIIAEHERRKRAKAKKVRK
jgi:hypothetical protein